MTKKQQPLEQVIYEEAQELAHRQNWTVRFTLSVMWSRFKSAGEYKEAEAAFISMQREEERNGRGDSILRVVKGRERKTSNQHLKAFLDIQ